MGLLVPADSHMTPSLSGLRRILVVVPPVLRSSRSHHSYILVVRRPHFPVRSYFVLVVESELVAPVQMVKWLNFLLFRPNLLFLRSYFLCIVCRRLFWRERSPILPPLRGVLRSRTGPVPSGEKLLRWRWCRDFSLIVGSVENPHGSGSSS